MAGWWAKLSEEGSQETTKGAHKKYVKHPDNHKRRICCCGGGSDHPVVGAALMNGPKTIDFGKLFNSIHEEIIVPIFSSSSSSQTDDSWINRRTTHRASLVRRASTAMVLKKLIFCAAQLGMGNERASANDDHLPSY